MISGWVARISARSLINAERSPISGLLPTRKFNVLPPAASTRSTNFGSASHGRPIRVGKMHHFALRDQIVGEAFDVAKNSVGRRLRDEEHFHEATVLARGSPSTRS